MRSLVGALVVVLVLVAAGIAVRRAATIEERLADAEEQLTTTTHVAADVNAEVDESTQLVARVPLLGPRLSREVRRQRAVAAYWQGDYGSLAPTTATTPGTDDPELLLLRANAAYRSAVRQNRTPQTLSKSLDDVLKAYGESVKADASSVDAAFNYEYVVRLRTALTAGKGGTVPPDRQSNMQGEQGEPPEGSRKSDFNVIVPLRPEERQEQLTPGAGGEFQRKG